jgi:hypothetical protein
MYIRLNSNCYKTLLVFILSFSLYFNGFSQAYAAALGGWSMGNPIAQGASTVYQGTKQVIIDGKDYIKKGTAIVTPTATGVAKVLSKGVAGVALSVAVEQLLGAVDWVLDPANNRITYKADPTKENISTPYIYRTNATVSTDNSSPYESCRIQSEPSLSSWNRYTFSLSPNGVDSSGRPRYTCNSVWYNDSQNRSTTGTTHVIPISTNPDYSDTDQKSLPLDVVAAQVISNAEGNTDKKAGAQVATGAAAADVVADAESDQTGTKARPIVQQLENSASTKPADEAAAAEANTATGTQTQNPTKPETTDLALEFPAFCGWAPIVCEAAQVVVVTVPETIDAVKEWVTPEPETPEPETLPEIPDAAVNISVTNYIQGSAYCPADRHVPLSMGGNTLDLVISYQPLCTVAQQFKPAVILMAFLAGAFIITNTGRRAETGD